MKKLSVVLVLILTSIVMAQSNKKLPYYEIPENPETYTAGTVAARMIDGLGFRYFWATESLRPQDLNYKPSESGRSSAEIIEHLYGLSKFIRNSILDKNKDNNKDDLSFDDKRKQTLANFKIVSDVLRNTKKPFKLDSTEIPFWNIINGPIGDALWHCGQVVMLRRASGNPFSAKVSVFSGKVKA